MKKILKFACIRRRTWPASLLLFAAGLVALLMIGELPNGLRWPARILGLAFASVGLAGLLAAVGGPLFRMTSGFRDASGRWDAWLAGIAVVMHSIMLWNSAVHNPVCNPDWHRHWYSVRALSQARLVEKSESKGFYYAPFAYAVPAAAHALGVSKYGALRLGMLANVAYSFVAVCFMLKLCQMLAPGSLVARRAALGALALLPLIYKSYAMQRPEPLLAALCAAALYYGVRIFLERDFAIKTFLKFGVAMGLAMLTRQWAIFILPALAAGLLFLIGDRRAGARRWAGGLALSIVVATLIAGWFYLAMQLKHGDAFAGSEGVNQMAIAQKDLAFYADLHPEIFFSRPVAWGLGMRFWPVLISEVFGDYYGYWFHPRTRQGLGVDVTRPDFAYAEYLGFANRIAVGLIALWVAAFAFAAAGARRRGWGSTEGRSFLMLLLAIFGSFLGLLWFNLNRGISNAIQPVYVLQMFPPGCALLGAGYAPFHERRPGAARAAAVLYAGLSLCLAPLFVTHIPDMIGWDRLEDVFNSGTLAVAGISATLVLLCRFYDNRGEGGGQSGPP